MCAGLCEDAFLLSGASSDKIHPLIDGLSHPRMSVFSPRIRSQRILLIPLISLVGVAVDAAWSS